MHYVHIAGHIGKDPETRFTADGQKVITLTVATNIRSGGKDETVWWRITLWGDRWDKMLPYLTKGKPIMVGGDLNRKPQVYTDKNGVTQVSALDVTADYVKFSPFGMPDQQNQDQKIGGYSKSANQRQSNNFGDPNQQQHGKNKNFGSDSMDFLDANAEDEEPIPF